MQRRAQQLRGFLGELEGKKPPSNTEYRIGGYTTCANNTPSIDIEDLRRSFSPCLFPCALAHEQRHAEQCPRYGALYMGVHHTEMERVGYYVELGCLLQRGAQ